MADDNFDTMYPEVAEPTAEALADAERQDVEALEELTAEADAGAETPGEDATPQPGAEDAAQPPQAPRKPTVIDDLKAERGKRRQAQDALESERQRAAALERDLAVAKGQLEVLQQGSPRVGSHQEPQSFASVAEVYDYIRQRDQMDDDDIFTVRQMRELEDLKGRVAAPGPGQDPQQRLMATLAAMEQQVIEQYNTATVGEDLAYETVVMLGRPLLDTGDAAAIRQAANPPAALYEHCKAKLAGRSATLRRIYGATEPPASPTKPKTPQPAGPPRGRAIRQASAEAQTEAQAFDALCDKSDAELLAMLGEAG